MILRTTTVLALLLAGVAATAAQETVDPATPPADATIQIDPAAPVNTSSKNTTLLTGLYATRATIEICAVTVDAAILSRMDADQQRLQSSLSMDAPTAQTAYDAVKADVTTTAPDCAEGSTDRQNVQQVVDLYATQN